MYIDFLYAASENEQFEVTKKMQADAMFDADMMPFT